MTGPSAIGSENGTPISITSAPASATAEIISIDASGSGCPAVRYAMSALRPLRRQAAKRSASASDEIVTDSDTIPLGVSRLDDRARIAAVGRFCSEIAHVSRVCEVAQVVGHDFDEGTCKEIGGRIHSMHDGELECIEDHQRP